MMTRLYGHRWTSSFSDEIDPGNVWAATLRGLREQDIKAGFAQLVELEYTWPPSAIEFRKLCRPATDTAKPDLAYTQLLDWSMQPKRKVADLPPQLWWCYQRIGAYEWAHMSGKEQRQAFNAAYSTALGMLSAGHVFDAAPEPKSEALLPVLPADQAQVENYITALMGALKD
jgi:hypothetical protein